MPRALALAVALALIVSLAGCSFLLVDGPSGQPRVYPDCSSSMGWPIVDGVIGGIMLAAALSGAVDDSDSMTSASTGSVIATGLIGTAFGLGAYIGYTRVANCRRARETFTMQYPGVSPYQYPTGYPQPAGVGYPPPQQTFAPQPQPQPQPPPPPAPAPPPPASALGTEGDVCMRSDECSAGLACAGNVCVRPKAPVRATPSAGGGRRSR